MLLTRVLTALVLLPLVVLGILFLPTTSIAAIAAGVLLIGAWEWGLLLRFTGLPARLAYAALGAAGLLWGWWSVMHGWNAAAVLAAAVAWWLAATAWICRFPRGWEATLGRWPVAALLGLLALTATLFSLKTLGDGIRDALDPRGDR